MIRFCASRQRPFQKIRALQRIRLWAGGPLRKDMDFQQYEGAFLIAMNSRKEFADFQIPLGDIINGTFQIVPEAIAEAVRAIQIGRVPAPLLPAAKRRLNQIFAEMRKFYGENYRPPWPEVEVAGIQEQLKELVAEKKFAFGQDLAQLKQTRAELDEVIERSEQLNRQRVSIGEDGVTFQNSPQESEGHVMISEDGVEFRQEE